MPAIRTFEPADWASTTNEELLQLAEQRGKIRLELKWSIFIPIRHRHTKRHSITGHFQGYTWIYRPLKEMTVHFDVLRPTAVWKIIRGCAALIRELAK